MDGIVLRVLHPQVAGVDCDRCLEFVYDLDPKSPRYGQQQLFNKQPVRYHEGACAPCLRDPEACPKGKPHGRELSKKNEQAWGHYQRCKAVGSFPEDATVEANAGLIESVLQAIHNGREEGRQMLMSRLIERLSSHG